MLGLLLLFELAAFAPTSLLHCPHPLPLSLGFLVLPAAFILSSLPHPALFVHAEISLRLFLLENLRQVLWLDLQCTLERFQHAKDQRLPIPPADVALQVTLG
ncbi:hypothetical protein BZA05DRAFT_404035 [Tricharina praecox]|uniref:uncharacterized protein n=1 Tax=Tricharina praecox TaxID=43433 RepID=UPI00221FFADF|nr:uncharacterized protein BZA05DRAFT_404035 [Tricharina praecox]KAI5848415.1 hypothetical protein BZA05DRAFT_404035 [Tricharina praecox]